MFFFENWFIYSYCSVIYVTNLQFTQNLGSPSNIPSYLSFIFSLILRAKMKAKVQNDGDRP